MIPFVILRGNGLVAPGSNWLTLPNINNFAAFVMPSLRGSSFIRRVPSATLLHSTRKQCESTNFCSLRAHFSCA
jgi:hypothetical protein